MHQHINPNPKNKYDAGADIFEYLNQFHNYVLLQWTKSNKG